MSSSSINYARLEGIHHSELPAAIIFAILYIPCIAIFLFLSFRRPTFVWRSLVIFSVVRATAFTMRAVLAGSSTAGTNLNVYIAEQVIYSIGFFGLLYSAYTLVLDRDVMVNGSNQKWQMSGPLGIITRLVRDRMVIRIILLVAVALGIAAGVKQSDSSAASRSTGEDLRKASLIIFLVACCLLLLVTLTLVYDEHRAGLIHNEGPTIGQRYGILILLAIALLCIMREAFLVGTLGNTARQNNAPLFYPLAALTEFLALLLFLVPGLVPSKYDLEARAAQAQDARGNGHAMKTAPTAYDNERYAAASRV